MKIAESKIHFLLVLISVLIISWINPIPENSDPFTSSDNNPEFEKDVAKSFASEEEVFDEDGNVYPVIQIGEQFWLGTNLKSTRFRSGGSILNYSGISPGENQSKYYTLYNNDPEIAGHYGLLYTWEVVNDPQGLCPSGWRVPSGQDWQNLVDYLDPMVWGNRNIAGIRLKSCRQSGTPLGMDCNTTLHPYWESHSRRFGSDDYGFSALPAGLGYEGAYRNLGTYAYFWTTAEQSETFASARVLLNSHNGVSTSNYQKDFALSVRCVKTAEGTTPTVKTNIVSATGNTVINCSSQVTHDGGAVLLSKGILWSKSSDLTIENYEGIEERPGETGPYNISVSGLIPGTTYYFRAWATNNNGTSLGNILSIKLDPEPELPTVVTLEPSDILPYSITANGAVLSDGHIDIASRGIVYALHPEPELSSGLGHTNQPGGIGEFSSILTPVWAETSLYVRAYATNALGTAYGEVLLVQTPDYENCGIVTDTDGNDYKTVIIGQKCFLRENLRTARFRNGDAISNVQGDEEWRTANSPAWVNYQNNPAYDKVYGKLYNWHAVNDERGLCPQGWRVTSREDMIILSEILGGGDVAGGKIKQSLNASQYDQALWTAPNTAATNQSGFTGLPHGYRLGNGYFGGLGTSAYWRTSTLSGNQSYQFYTYYDSEALSIDLFGHQDGDGVRCVKED
jgi:uncharacterized protein (TIGR02145 family)